MSTQGTRNSPKEQQFFEDAAIDRMMGMVMALATEVFVLRSRMRAVENLMSQSDLSGIDTLHETEGDEEPSATKDDARKYAEALLKPLLGTQDAVGPISGISAARVSGQSLPSPR